MSKKKETGKQQPEPRQMTNYDKDIAFKDYLMLGSERSVKQLKSYYTSQEPPEGVIYPGLQTLKNWSARYKWPSRAVEYDNSLREKIVSKTVAEQAEEIAGAVGSMTGQMRGVATRILRRLFDAVEQVPIRTPNDIKTLAETVAKLLYLHQELVGTATDKRDQAEAQDEGVGAGAMAAQDINLVMAGILSRFDTNQHHSAN